MSYLQKSIAGFTLIEVLVSMTLFITAMSMGVMSVVGMNNASKRIKSKDQAVQSAYYVIDSLSRSIRMGCKYACTQYDSANCIGISYLDQDRKEVEVWYDSASGVLKRKYPQTANSEVNLHDPYALKFNSFRFVVGGEIPDDVTQPYISMRMLARYDYKGTQHTIPLQTMLTQRRLDLTQAGDACTP